ncbi:GTPase family protein [Desulforapulum autotrophicum HRM2]|uniref:GTPase family protein n=2 Tax=Desulforapulum autotrophicum TaxID=2296 RepID=C0QFZ1_DESAH|nr:GTPase family protein [Desulforapulum autotrophicum HRM2]
MTMTEKILYDIETISSNLGLTLESMREIPGMYDTSADTALELCCTLPGTIRSNILKIAVVGAIKSGKTTFINAWLKDDLLKRGAGVVTAIVTRLQRQSTLTARIFLKSWDDINQEIEQALFMFPEKEWNPEKNTPGFDLRRERDRQFLNDFNVDIFSDLSVSEAGLRPESVTITRAVEGYEAVKDLIKPDRSILEFSGPLFETHKKFTGNDSRAFFVRDVALGVTSPGLDPDIEIADCQGSDSTNPFHMVQIQNYLTRANLIIYLISSRTGLRQADMNFLRVIETMGLMENIVFVLNADLNEHENLKDLMSVEHRVRKELTYIKKDPELYTISSLYNLFCDLAPDLSRKNSIILDLWKEDANTTAYLSSMTQRFNSRLVGRLSSERFYLTVANPIERLRQIAFMARQRLSLFSDLLSQDLSKARGAMDRLAEMLETGKKLEAIMDNSIEGAVDQLEREIQKEANALFDPLQGTIAKDVAHFIGGCKIDISLYESKLLHHGFENTLYLMFQELKSALDTFMTQTINARVLGFIHDQEKAIEGYFKTLYRSYDINPHEISPVKDQDHQPETAPGRKIVPIDLRTIKGILGLSLPTEAFVTRYNARIRVSAMAKFGLFSLGDIIGRLMNRRRYTPGVSALSASEKKIKQEALRSVVNHLEAYQKSVTRDYLIPLLEAVSRDFKDKLVARCRVCDVEIETMEGVIALDQASKKAQSRTLDAMAAGLTKIVKKIESLPVQYLN